MQSARMDEPAQKIMNALKRTLDLWVNEIADDAAKQAGERAYKLARERVAKALGAWAAESTLESLVGYERNVMKIVLTIPFAAIERDLGSITELLGEGFPKK